MNGMTEDKKKYLRLLAEKYPSERSLTREIINLNAILNLPKGTEHFMSDLHGEYEAFCHILNNCSGVVREKIENRFGDSLTHSEVKELCTLIYYPKEKLRLLKKGRELSMDWYRTTLERMLEVARVLIHPLEGAQGDARGLRLHHRRAAPRPEGRGQQSGALPQRHPRHHSRHRRG